MRLYIVKGLTEALGGTLTLESRSDVGSRFVVWLPLGVQGVTIT